jgi:hypothetical protein
MVGSDPRQHLGAPRDSAGKEGPVLDPSTSALGGRWLRTPENRAPSSKKKSTEEELLSAILLSIGRGKEGKAVHCYCIAIHFYQSSSTSIGSHSNKGMQMELKIGKKAATAPRHATARAGWWARPLHLPLSLRLPRQRTGPVRWMRSAG